MTRKGDYKYGEERERHKALHGENAMNYIQFAKRCRRYGREESIKYPKNHNWGGPRTSKKYTIKQFQQDYYPDIQYQTFFDRYKKSYKLQKEHERISFFEEKH